MSVMERGKMSTKEEELSKLFEYEFKDISILKRALTHSSYANENKDCAGGDNERLEFLGDAVLEIVTSEFLFHKYKDKPEGELSKLRASIVCEQTLDLCAKPMKFSDYIYLGKGEENTGGRKRPSIVSDAFEAVIGALYLDGGIEVAKAFIYKYVLDDVESKQLYVDSKTHLQEYVQGKYHSVPRYEHAGESGPEHNKTFFVDLYVNDIKISSGEGHNKKAAEQQAAYNALMLVSRE